jgi:cobalt-zinc-cadmium efflux system outer membrane protein
MSKIKLAMAFFFLWMIVSFASEARAESPLALDSVLEELRQDYPPLQEARLKLEATRGKLLAKQGNFDTKIKSKVEGTPLGYYPKLLVDSRVEQPTPWWGATFFSGYRLGIGSFADYEGKKETLNLGEFQIGAAIPLLRNGAIDIRRADIAILELQVAMAELEVFNKQLKFVDKALKSYWSWVATHAKRKVSEDILNLAELRNAQLQEQINLGKKPPVDALKNQQAVLKRSNQLIAAEQAQQQAAYELSFYLQAARVPVNAPEFPDFACQLPPNALDQALQQRPERLILQLQQEQNQIALDLAQNQLLPDLEFYMALSQDIGEGSKTKKPFEADTGLKLELPIQWRKQRGQLQILNAEREQLSLQDRFLQIRIRNELQAALIARRAACQQIEMNQKLIQTSRELAQAELDRFQLGSSDLLLVNLREQQIAEAQSKFIEALKEYFIADGRYYLSLGLLPQSQNQ